MLDDTMQFSLGNDRELRVRLLINGVYSALQEKGYNPINQLVGYIISGDPTYITTHRKARSLICRVDREEILRVIMKHYLKNDRDLSEYLKRKTKESE